MLTADKFKRVGYTKEEAERIDRPTISYWQDAWRRLKKNPVAMASLVRAWTDFNYGYCWTIY